MSQTALKIFCLFLVPIPAVCQIRWKNVDSAFGPLPASVHVYFSNDSLDQKPSRAYYMSARLDDRKLEFTADTSMGRRLQPRAFFEKNGKPLAVVNCTFFSFETNRNLNVVLRDHRLLSYNVHSIAGRGRDTFTFRHPLTSAIGLTSARRADVAWVFTDSSLRHAYAVQCPVQPHRDSSARFTLAHAIHGCKGGCRLRKWKMQTAVGGGPALLQNGEICITNNEELKFAGRAILDRHPRTAMGYTADDRLIILVIEGRNANAAGATLVQTAQILRELGCIEALNLDGGGSSCLLVNGKETIRVSDGSQRPVPAVFIVKTID